MGAIVVGVFVQPSNQIVSDIQKLSSTIQVIQEQIDLSAKVVVQNKSGLDLLLLNEGSLRATLKEECCFYVDHSGIIKDAMSKLRENIKSREKNTLRGHPSLP